MKVNVSHEFLPKRPTLRANLVMDHFGLDFEQGRHVLAENLELPIEPGQIVLFTGASGSGKSSLMRAVAEQLAATAPGEAVSSATGDGGASAGNRPAVLQLEGLDLGTRVLIDELPGAPEAAMQLLAQCGLGEARLLLRTAAELSDGQRYRYRLALGVARQPQWLVADEFTATLDRTLAKVIAFNVRRLADRTGVGFLLATTHEDVVDDLQPDVHVRCALDGATQVARRGVVMNDAAALRDATTPSDAAVVAGLSGAPARAGAGCKKKASASPPSCGSVGRPSATGRTSLGGITGRITSGSSSS